MSSKLLVTGSSGYIGAITCEHLRLAGYRVIGADIKPMRCFQTMEDFYLGDIYEDNFISYIETKHRDIKTIVHLAGLIDVAESVQNPYLYLESNYYKPVRLLERLNFNKVIFASTAAVYKSKEEPLKEEDALEPANPYGESKLFLERYLQQRAENYVIFRFFNACGSDYLFYENHEPETHLIPLLLNFAKGISKKFSIYGDDYNTPDGTAIRDYVHVLDIAEAISLAVSREEPVKEIFNIGTGLGKSVKEVVSTVENITGNNLAIKTKPRRPGDSASLIACPDKLLNHWGFKATRTLEEVIRSALI